MKNLRLLGVLATAFFIFFTPLILAAEGNSFILTGVLIDNACSGAHLDNLEEFVKTHTKECVLMPDCFASGFGIYADGELYKFDAASNKKVGEFLRVKVNGLKVVVTVRGSGDELILEKIESQK